MLLFMWEVCVCLPLVLLVSLVVYHTVEKPCRPRVYQRLRGARDVTSATRVTTSATTSATAIATNSCSA